MQKNNNASKKYLHIMRIAGVPMAIIFLLLNVGYAGNGQAQAILQREITLSASNASLEEVLRSIEDTHDVHFTYSIQKVDVSQSVAIKKKTYTLEEILNELLDPLSIKYLLFNNRNIVLLQKEKKPPVATGIVLSGIVHSESGEPLQFANVLLQNVEVDKKMRGAVTDELGEFVIDKIHPAKYQLTISFIGFESIDTLLDISEKMDLGKIIMREELNALHGISVSARRKLIRQEIDRLVLDIENSMLASRGTALDVLASTPGISVRNDQVNMIGKSSVGIMIDEKLIRLAPMEVANYLRSIASEDIKHIEVISNPPSKYEAEGNSGLINIVLKKVRRNSWNASLRSGYTKKTNSSGHTSINFVYNKNKLSLATSLFYIEGKYYQEQDDYAYFPDGLWYTSSPLLSDYQRLNGRIDLSYQLTPSWSIGGQVMRNSTDYLITDNPYTPVFDNETNEIQRYLLSTFSQMTWKPKFNASNINSTINLDTFGRTVKINLDFFEYENEDIREYIGESVINNPMSKQYYAGYNENLQGVDNVSGAIDFDYPTSWAELGFGGKLTRSTSTNDIALINSGLVDNEVTDQPLVNNDFKYVENLQALYVNLSRSLTDKLSLQLGARVEATQTESNSKNLNLAENNNYIKVFPTLYFNYTQSDQVSYGLNYGRRISRPTFGQLNPNVFFINPFQTIVGNAFLQPSFTDNVELAFSHRNLTIKFYFSREQDIFAQIPLPNSANNVITFINENYVNTNRYGLSEYFVFDRMSWWSSSNSFDINYTVSTFDLPEVHDDLKGFSSSLSTSNDFTFKPIGGISIYRTYIIAEVRITSLIQASLLIYRLLFSICF